MNPGSIGRRFAPYGWAVACVLLTQLLRLALDPVIGPRTPFVVLFFLPVIVAAWRGGVGPALVAAVLGLALGDRVSMDFDNGIPFAARVVRIGTFVFESWFVGWLFESRQREARARLDAESQHRVLLENFPGGCVLMVDSELRYVLAAGAGLADIDLRAIELVGRTPEQVFGSEEGARIAAIHRTALAGRSESLEIELRGASFLVRSAPLLGEGGRPGHALAVMLNATERKQLERELRETQKLEAVGKLASGVAHDFNNVLGVITACAEALDETRPTDEQARFIRLIGDASNRGNDLTKQLVEFGRRQFLSSETLDVNALVSELRPFLESLVGDKAVVDYDLGASVGPITVNRIEAERSIVNLVANARDSIATKGTIRIRTRARSGADAARDELVLEVIDDGAGMDAATRSNLGKRFFTTKGAGRGTGLGLSVVFAFAGRSRGRVEIESEEGKGSTFRLVIPQAEADSEITAMRVVRPIPPSRAVRVLIVDDEDSIRSLTVQFLTARGFAVDEARDAETALTMLRDDLAVVITDLVLPGMNGIELCRRLHRERPQLRLVLVSGSNEIDARTESLVEVGARFLPKPFHLRDLAAIVESITSAESQEIEIDRELAGRHAAG